MNIAHYIIGAATSLALVGPAFAQTNSFGAPQTQPYGTTFSQSAQPYQPAGRDENGNRIIINGQLMGSGASNNPARTRAGLASRSGSTLPMGGTLSRAGTTAVSIGNSVSISGTMASTIIINQTNNSSQTVNVNGTPQTRGR